MDTQGNTGSGQQVQLTYRDGEGAGPHMQMVDPNSVPSVKGKQKSLYDIRTDEGMALLIAELCEKNGKHEQAALIRGKKFEDDFAADLGRAWNAQIRTKHLVTAVLVGAALFLVYEGVAAQFDWPRFGLFGSADDAVKELKGRRTA